MALIKAARIVFAIALLSIAGVASAQQGEVLVIQESAPWGYNAFQAVLNAAGIQYTQINYNVVAQTNLDQYDVVITTSVQGTNYDNELQAQMPAFEAYVQGGGVLIWSGCTHGKEKSGP